jgi:hypothetical protein
MKVVALQIKQMKKTAAWSRTLGKCLIKVKKCLIRVKKCLIRAKNRKMEHPR